LREQALEFARVEIGDPHITPDHAPGTHRRECLGPHIEQNHLPVVRQFEYPAAFLHPEQRRARFACTPKSTLAGFLFLRKTLRELFGGPEIR
jgi:hypothetical protein